MSDLIEFLSARLDEDEASAARSQSVRNMLDDQHRQITPDARYGAEYVWRETAASPARWHREVAAKRAILAWFGGSDPDGPAAMGIAAARDWALRSIAAQRIMAAVYSDHPDYRPEEWKP